MELATKGRRRFLPRLCEPWAIPARGDTHVTETKSRRIVAALLPPDRFLERDQGERDYGIDLIVECFDEGEPSGAQLLIQLKGTTSPPPPPEAATVPFDFPVDRLLRAERFSTPLLLVWVPVEAEPPCCWFLWIQEYIRVVLDFETPRWREQQTVRLHIPRSNVLPADQNYDRLRFIAGHPARVEAMALLGAIAHEAQWRLEDPARLIESFREALSLEPIFGDRSWGWGQLQRLFGEQGVRACELLMREPPSIEELAEVGQQLTADGVASSNSDPDLLRMILRGAAHHHAGLLSTDGRALR